MAKPQSIKPQGVVGTALYGVGNYAIMMTLQGSYGECVHRIVGGTYWNPEKCIQRALKYHAQGKRDVELVNLRTGLRVSVREIERRM